MLLLISLGEASGAYCEMLRLRLRLPLTPNGESRRPSEVSSGLLVVRLTDKFAAVLLT